MDFTVLFCVVGGAVLLSIIYVFSLCIHCWRSKQPTSIHQRTSDSSPEYQVSGFVVRHLQSTYQPHDHQLTLSQRITSTPCPSNVLSSPIMTAVNNSSCPPSEAGSQASYVNQSDDEMNDRCLNKRDSYIEVLGDIKSSSRPSSKNSVDEDYVNVKVSNVLDGDEKSDYINLNEYPENQTLGIQTRDHSCGSLNSDDQGSSDYVNTEKYYVDQG